MITGSPFLGGQGPAPGYAQSLSDERTSGPARTHSERGYHFALGWFNSPGGAGVGGAGGSVIESRLAIAFHLGRLTDRGTTVTT